MLPTGKVSECKVSHWTYCYRNESVFQSGPPHLCIFLSFNILLYVFHKICYLLLTFIPSSLAYLSYTVDEKRNQLNSYKADVSPADRQILKPHCQCPHVHIFILMYVKNSQAGQLLLTQSAVKMEFQSFNTLIRPSFRFKTFLSVCRTLSFFLLKFFLGTL